jgi:MFS superfamily sulfate permease-like transporter
MAFFCLTYIKMAFLQGGILTGLVVLLSLAFLMPYCAFIPRTTLASVIICAVIFSIEYHVVIPIWKSKSNENAGFSLIKIPGVGVRGIA